MSYIEDQVKTSSDKKRFLEFRLGEDGYVVDLSSVKEVITPPDTTPIPKSMPYVCGLMNLRGIVLTVVDLRKKLSIVPSKDTSQNAVIIFDLRERLVGVVVDSIEKVLSVSQENIKPVPDADSQALGYLKGIVQHEDKLSMWLDPDLILDTNGQFQKNS